MGRLWKLLVLLLVLPSLGWAEERRATLHAPDTLIETGLMKHILPRFSLKTQIKVDMVADAEAQVVLGASGRALFKGAGQVWHLDVPGAGDPSADALAGWLTSEVGTRTIESFAPGGVALFAAQDDVAAELAPAAFDAEAEAGQAVARAKCTRCHAVDQETQWSPIGSTPSFAVLRTFSDWEERFVAFYTLKPHAAFTQITNLTLPFPIARPSPIAPIELSLDEVDALVAYVAVLPAADLGEPLKHQ